MQWPRDWWKQLVTAVKVWIDWRKPIPVRDAEPNLGVIQSCDTPASRDDLMGRTGSAPLPTGAEPLVVESLALPLPPEPAAPNRAERRARGRQWRLYEKQRRKFNKFVEPQGVAPQGPEPKEAVAEAEAEPVLTSEPEPEPEPESEPTVWGGEYLVDRTQRPRHQRCCTTCANSWGLTSAIQY
jgi:hypothetical protein